MARAYAELLTPREFQLTTFDNDEGYDQLVLAPAIRIRSVCEHHLLPFVGVAQCRGAVRPRSSGAGTPDKQIADWLTTYLRPVSVGVVIEAEHLCMTLRAVQAVGATTITSTLLGTLREARSRAEFFTSARCAPPGPSSRHVGQRRRRHRQR